MSLPEIGAKIKDILQGVGKGDLYVVLIVVLVGFSGYGLGHLSKVEETLDVPISLVSVEPSTEVQSETQPVIEVAEATTTEPVQEGLLVGSRNSNKFHYPWCSGALRIKEENKIWFASVEEAKSKGYLPASNCKGLE